MKLRPILLSLIGLLFSTQSGFSQDLTGWGADTLEMTNTAKNATYLTVEEKKVIQLMNLARLDGKSFSKRVALPYIAKNGLDNDEYLTSLVADLEKTQGLHLLAPHHKLHES